MYTQRESVQCSYALYKHTVYSYDATFLRTPVYSWIKEISGEFTKKVLVNKDRIKAEFFKPNPLIKM